jgi:hypothetical protein
VEKGREIRNRARDERTRAREDDIVYVVLGGIGEWGGAIERAGSSKS